jgi:hypothetical protein
MNDPSTPGADLGQLRAEHPDWHIEHAWTARGSGPDFRLLTARRGGVRLAGFSVPELARMIETAEDKYGWGG